MTVGSAAGNGIHRLPRPIVMIACLCLAAILLSPCAAGESGGKNLALCIGVGKYDNLPAIASAAAAAVNQRRMLDASGDFRRVFVLTDIDAGDNAYQAGRIPTRDNILRTLKLLANNATQGSDLSVYFNGHGLTLDGKAFLLPSDAPAFPLESPDPVIPLAEVLAVMKNSRAASKTLILDVCHSGEFAFDANDELAGLGDDFTVTVTYVPGQAEPSAAAIIDMADGEAGLTSHMIHPIDAGSEKAGLRLVRADDLGGKVAPGLLSPTQTFEILRPDMGEITLARDHGNVIAQFNLGGMYRDGKGVGQDYSQAAEWFRKAADQGNANAMTSLANMYEKGRGVAQDYVQAIYWYKKAATLGNAIASNNIGNMYLAGRGLARDYGEAEKWFREAISRGLPIAQTNLDTMFANIAEEQRQAEEERRRAELASRPVQHYHDNGLPQTDPDSEWEFCYCGEPDCIIGCPEYEVGDYSGPEYQAAYNQMMREEEERERRSSSWYGGPSLGGLSAILGIASAVIPFVGGGGKGSGKFSDAALFLSCSHS